MGLRFIVGRAGSGKTHTCLTEIIQYIKTDNTVPAIFIVPEQSTYQMEKELSTAFGLNGIMGAEVLSFKRLAYRVLKEVGGARKANVGSVGRSMLLRKLVEDHKKELKLFHKICDRKGFISFLSETVTEMKTSCIEPDKLSETLAATPEGLLKDKLNDLYILYNSFVNLCADKYMDPDDYLKLLALKLNKSKYLCGAHIWVDGFYGFSAQEYKVLENLMKAAGEMSVTLCDDPGDNEGKNSKQDVFYRDVFAGTRETRERLEKIALQNGVPVHSSAYCAYESIPGHKASELDYIEKAFFSLPVKQFESDVKLHDENECEIEAASSKKHKFGINMISALNPSLEVESVALEITRLCRDEGYRWRDISIELRDLPKYYETLNTVFSRYQIPFFADEKRSIMHFPAVELLRSALEVILRNWSYESVFRFLKTDLAGVERKDIDRLENYVLAFGINGSRWTISADWTYRKQYSFGEDADATENETQELEDINRIKREAAAPLQHLAETLRKSTNVREMTAAIYEFLIQLKVPETLKEWAMEASENGKPEESQQLVQAWDSIIEVLERMIEALGKEKMPLGEFARILDAGLEEFQLGLIPPGLDQVIVGNLERSRNPGNRAVFVLGVCEGTLPGKAADKGVFSDQEKVLLHNAGLEVDDDSRRRMQHEQFLIYLALTRASERLYICYPMSDSNGGSQRPSYIVGRLRKMFPYIKETVYPILNEGTEEDTELVGGIHSTIPFLVRRMREGIEGKETEAIWRDVLSCLKENPEWRTRYIRFVEGLKARNSENRLSPAAVKALYGNPLKASVYKLEKFQQCPFSYFMQYGLKLQDRPAYRLSIPDLGQFYHRAIYLLFEKAKQQGVELRDMDAEFRKKVVGELADELVPQLQNEILLSNSRLRYLKKALTRVLDRSASMLALHARKDGSKIAGMELAFGPGGELPPVIVPIVEDICMEISGRIDRVDYVDTDQGRLFKVVDYKTGDKNLSVNDIYYGMNIQLLTYLEAILTHAGKLSGVTGEAREIGITGDIEITGDIGTKGSAANPNDLTSGPGAMLYFKVDDPLVDSQSSISPEEVEQEIEKKLKMKGLLLADEQMVRLMDGDISGYSSILPVGLKKDGGFYSNSSVLTAEQFEILRKHLRKTIAEIGSEIVEGKVDIKPSKRGAFQACMYCEFFVVCRFDTLLKENVYRILKDEDPEILWERMKKIVEGTEDGQ